MSPHSPNRAVEPDPEKIAQRLEQTTQARQKARPASRAETVRQLQEHARLARPLTGKAADKPTP